MKLLYNKYDTIIQMKDFLKKYFIPHEDNDHKPHFLRGRSLIVLALLAVLPTLFHSFSASVIMGLIAYILLNVFDNIFNLNTFIGIFLQGFLSGLGGITVGIIVLVLMKNDELHEVWLTLHHKIWKAKVIGVDATETTL